MMPRLLLLFTIAALLLPSVSVAQDPCEAQLRWEAPTENVDGSPLTDLAGFRVYWKNTDQTNPYTLAADDPPNWNGHKLTIAPDTPYWFVVTAYDADDDESAHSNEVTKSCTTVPPSSPPLPPALLLEEQTVFTVVKQPDRFVLLPIGTVPAGTSCDMNNTTNGHGAVPTAVVVWTDPDGPRPIVVVAQCDG